MMATLDPPIAQENDRLEVENKTLQQQSREAEELLRNMKREQDNIGMLRKHLMVVENGNTTAIPDHILTRTTSRSENRTERKESRPGQAGGGVGRHEQGSQGQERRADLAPEAV